MLLFRVLEQTECLPDTWDWNVLQSRLIADIIAGQPNSSPAVMTGNHSASKYLFELLA